MLSSPSRNSPSRNSPSRKKPERQEPPVKELSDRLDHLKTSILVARKAYVESLRNPSNGEEPKNASASTPSSFSRFFRRRSSTPLKGTPSSPSAASPQRIVTPTKPPPNCNNSATSPPRSSPNRKTNDPEARFIEIPDADALVENLRRVAELVVVGENFVTSTQKKEEAAFKRDQEKWKNRDILVVESESVDDNENQQDEVEHKDEYMQLFDLFFERNGLEMFINLITGATFRLTEEEKQEIEESFKTEDEDEDNSEQTAGEAGEPGFITPTKTARPRLEKVAVLPQFLVATQALQSVSILVQNVSRATSLYVLLSNNFINDLINLPLRLYLSAERHRQLESGLDPQPMTFASPEISELTTHFVTFLKSLALRMNAQTLQFFLKYPAEAADVAGDARTASSSHFSLEYGSEDGSRHQPLKHLQVDFPLYDRALEFCGAHHDSFIRITAMNICLNTLRLTTVAAPDEILPEEEAVLNFSLGSSPDGVLHNSKPLPFRERLAIAQHTCIPSRVERLISPIFTKLAERWNALDEQIREIHSNNGGVTDSIRVVDVAGSGSRNEKMAKAKEKVRRQRLIGIFKDKAADLQDELLLLEDVFKVGLTVLNEQMIEMMLATFVYPLLLQPLLLYCQRLSVALEMPVHSFSEHPLGGYAGDYSEAERNLAPVSGPAQTALFSLASVFHFLSNRPLLRLISTALLHPLSPDSSGVPTLRSNLEVATMSECGRKSIRLDRKTQYSGSGDRSTYAFGTKPGNRRVSKTMVDLSVVVDGGEACVFVLSPALAEVLEFRGDDGSLIARTRPNQYRRAFLQFLDAPADISDIRGLAFHALDAALTALDGQLASDILFGNDLKKFADDMPVDERTLDSSKAHSSDDRGIGGGAVYDSRKSLEKRKGGSVGSDLTNEVIPSLCRCVINASKQPLRTSEWKLEYEEVAAHALLCSVRCSARAMHIAAATIDNLWWKAASFVSAIPVKMPPPMGGLSIPMPGAPSVNDPDYDTQIEGALMNYIFYDGIDASDNPPAVDMFLKVREKEDGQDGYYVAVSCQSAFDSVCNRIGRFLLEEIENGSLPLSVKEEVQLSRHDASALLKLNALSNLLKDMAATSGGLLRESAMAGIAVTTEGTLVETKESFVTDLTKKIHSPLSSSVINCLFDDRVGGELPATGSAIDLSGKPLLPCVCEVPSSLAHLFTSASSGIVSEGVTWQSLYLVFSDGLLILAQPHQVAGSSEGRVITSFLLERLSVQQDESADDTGPPARRLMLFHKWFSPNPPTFLMFDSMPEYEDYGPFIRAKPFTSTVDIWFEDKVTAKHAYQILTSQIFVAKSERGNRVEVLLAPEQN